MQEIFPSRLANPINKLVLHTRFFFFFFFFVVVFLSDLQLSRKILPVSESQCELISISGTLRVVQCWLIFI